MEIDLEDEKQLDLIGRRSTVQQKAAKQHTDACTDTVHPEGAAACVVCIISAVLQWPAVRVGGGVRGEMLDGSFFSCSGDITCCSTNPEIFGLNMLSLTETLMENHLTNA